MATRRAFLLAALATGGTAVIGGLGVSALSGDGKQSGDPVIHFGSENCAGCSMPIDDRRWIAAWRSNGKELHFDDIGCMVDLARKRSLPTSAVLFVNDLTSAAWTDGTTAQFVVSPAYKTPMAYGVAGFSRTTDAEAAASQNNTKPWTWSDLIQKLPSKG